MKCPTHRGRSRPAFSLVELLTVVVCVVLLVLLVQPSLHLSRERAKLSVCLDRLRTIGTASAIYASDDPSGWAIPVHPLQYDQDNDNPTFIGAYEWGGKSGIGANGWCSFPGDPLSSKYGTRCGFGPASRPLNGILYPHGFRDNLDPELDDNGALLDTQLELPAYRCPSDDRPPDGAHCPSWTQNPARSSYDHFGNSYAANLFMVAHETGGEMISNSPYLRPLSRISNPSRVLLFEENIGRWAYAAREDPCSFLTGVALGPSQAIRGWHSKDWTFNRVFGDTHAETQAVYIERTTDAEGYVNHYYNEHVSFYPPWPEEDGSFSQGSFARYRCIIIRGDGWQKDTMPAELIRTGLHHDGIGRPSYEGCVSE